MSIDKILTKVLKESLIVLDDVTHLREKLAEKAAPVLSEELALENRKKINRYSAMKTEYKIYLDYLRSRE